VARVEFFSGTTKLGEDTSAPYTLQWNAGPSTAGTHTTARATDNAGAPTTSTAGTITVKKKR
jgi:Bacterial Ig domain